MSTVIEILKATEEVLLPDGRRILVAALERVIDADRGDRVISGAPVVDCAGRVVAVVSNLFTTTMQFMSRTVRISTAWGSPNVVSVPIPGLKNFPAVE